MRGLVAAMALFALPVQAQETPAGLICLSVGDAQTYTVLVMYGADGAMVSMQIPPDGAAEPAEAAIVQQAPEVFTAMADVLRPGLDALPLPPDAAACVADTLGPVTMALRRDDGAVLSYRAPCTTPEVLALNAAMIEATGDPEGLEVTSWTAPAIPGHRAMCEDLQ